MRVGLPAYLLHSGADYRAAGVSVYTLQLLRHLPVVAPQHAYIAFVGPDAPSLENVNHSVAPLPTERPPIRIAWEQLALPVQLLRAEVDLLHAPVNVVPLLARKPSVVTVHDLAFLRHPERFSPYKAAYLKLAVTASVRRARHVICVSHNTQTDLMDLLRVAESKATVVYPGVDERFKPLPGAERERLRAELTGGEPFILYVGTLEPRKNVDVLIRAFHSLRSRVTDLPHRLVLAGAAGWMYESLYGLVDELDLHAGVRFLGYVRPEDLPLWYNAADLFVYPSAYEGFGLPLLEAMACGVACITSSSSSLQEVAADACLMVEPGSVEDLAMAISRALTEESLRSELANKGLRRSEDFSWHETARQTASVYERTLALPSP